MFIGFIENEQNEKKKSPMIYVAIKSLFDCLMIHSIMLETNEETKETRNNLRKILIK
jgi:hypothetical protein